MAEALAVACFYWSGNRGFTPKHVNVLQRMVKRHLTVPHRFICISCETDGFSPDVEVLKTPKAALELAKLRTLHGDKYPSCFRRIWLFSEAGKLLADRILLLDVDLVITANIDFLVERDEDFVGWRPTQICGAQRERVAGGAWLLRAGTRNEVYDNFKGIESMKLANEAGFDGSDQAWISYCLAKDAALWDRGIGSIKEGDEIHPIMQFNGDRKPWDMRHIQWVNEHYR